MTGNTDRTGRLSILRQLLDESPVIDRIEYQNLCNQVGLGGTSKNSLISDIQMLSAILGREARPIRGTNTYQFYSAQADLEKKKREILNINEKKSIAGVAGTLLLGQKDL